jgi:hypothetical protein
MTTPSPIPAALSAPVGPKLASKPQDVETVRALLNRAIDGGLLIPLAPIPPTGGWDDHVTFALNQVERRYFHGLADPNGKLETSDSLFQFLVHADITQRQLGAQLSAEMYQLAAHMVPGGMDIVKRTIVKTSTLLHGKTVVKKTIKKEILPGHIRTYLPDVLDALTDQDMNDTSMVMMALGTIRAETSGFEPIDEGISHYNTSPAGTKGRHPYDLYDHRTDLGNDHSGDGDLYKGRGFVQLTGHDNYKKVGGQIGVDLVADPDLANDSGVAAKVLAQFLKNNETAIRAALKVNNLRTARRLVNGGSHGLSEFIAAFNSGRRYLGIVITQKAKAHSKAKAKH